MLCPVVNERQLVPLAAGLRLGRPGTLSASRSGPSGPASRSGAAHRAGYAASVVYVLGLLFCYAWVGAGKLSARDVENVAEMARFRRDGH